MRGPNQKKIPKARKLRRHSTSAESKLWAELRNRQLDGFSEEIERDTMRTSFLKGLGYSVIRVQNDDVYNAMEGVLRTIQLGLESSGQ